MGVVHENTAKYDRLKYDGIEGKGYFEGPPKVRLFMSYRLLAALVCMMCMLTNFASQATMSSAMVCMIRLDNTSNGISSTPVLNNSSESLDSRHSTNDKQPWKFDWSPATQGWILFSFFVCYVITQIPSGLLVSRYGPRRILVMSQICAGMGQLLTVPATQLGLPYVYVARVITGLSTGCLFPSIFGLIAKWAPRQEASLLYGITGVGIEAGNTFSFGISMFACEMSFQGGWPIVFYAMGGLQILLAMFILWRLTDVPSRNRYISHQEAMYIEWGVAGKSNGERPIVPMRRILKSMCVYAIAVSQCGTLLMYYTVITQGPIYLRDVIQLSSIEINMLLAVPFVSVIPLVYVLGRVCDWLVTKEILTMTALRKVMDGICKLFGMAAVGTLAMVPRHDSTSAFMSYLLVAMSVSLAYVSHFPNLADLSPAHTGFISSIQQGGSLWVSFVIPPVVGAIVSQGTRESWQMVFFAEIGIQALAYLFYLKFGSGELQPWAVEEEPEAVSKNPEKERLITGISYEDKQKSANSSTASLSDFWSSLVISERTALLTESIKSKS